MSWDNTKKEIPGNVKKVTSNSTQNLKLWSRS